MPWEKNMGRDQTGPDQRTPRTNVGEQSGPSESDCQLIVIIVYLHSVSVYHTNPQADQLKKELHQLLLKDYE